MGRVIDSMVNDRQFRSATWGILIVDPETRDTLYSHNASKLLIPASNQKLVVSSVMLEQLGPQYRYRTTFGAQGQIIEGTLNGNLAVIGGGDPTPSNHMCTDAMTPMREIADSLVARGIRRITGRVVLITPEGRGKQFLRPLPGTIPPRTGVSSFLLKG